MQHGLNPAFPDGEPSPINFWKVLQALVIFGIVFGMVMGAAGVYCFSLPRHYYSRVIMEVKPDSNAVQVFEGGDAFRPARDPNLQPTQFQVIQSKEILYPVIDNLKLVETWSSQEGGNVLPKEEAYGRLLGQMKLNTVRATDLIEIGVFSTDRVEAANVANMIAVTYQKVRRDDQMRVRDAALAQLREEVATQRKTVEAALAKKKRIQEQEGIVDPHPESLETPQIAVSRDYINAKSQCVSANRVFEEAEKRLSTQSVLLKMTVVPAKIWEKAEPAVYPAKPSVERIMALGAGGGVILGIFAAGLFLRSSRRN